MAEPALQDLLSRGVAGKLRLSQLVPWDENPRDHSPEQLRLLVKSIQVHGFVAPFLLQAETNKMVAGHGRRLALLSMAAKGSDPEVPVVWAPLTDEQAAAYAVADNRLTDLSEWNIPGLRAIMAELDNGAFDIEATGFTAESLGDLFGAPGPTSGLLPGKDPEDAPPLPPPAEVVSRLGDLIVMGDHRLLCGDSTDPLAWARLMGTDKADLVLTDPPYGVSYESSAAGLKADGRSSIQNDALTGEAFQSFLDRVFGCLASVSQKKAAFYVFYPSRFHREFETGLNRARLDVRAQIIWVKNAASFGFAQYKWKHEPVLLAAHEDEVPLIYLPSHETAFYAFKQGNSPFWEGDRCQTTVWSVSRETGYVHPTQKPVELLKKPMLNSSRPGMLVVDAFGGSGSTLITCEMLGRRSCTMELDPAFVDVIVTRWQNATGKIAVRHRTE